MNQSLLPFSVIQDPTMDWALWYVYYENVLCGVGLSEQEALDKAANTLKAIGIQHFSQL